MLETARIGRQRRSVQECSSIGRAPVSKTGGRRFEPCHSCQLNQYLSGRASLTSIAACAELHALYWNAGSKNGVSARERLNWPAVVVTASGGAVRGRHST